MHLATSDGIDECAAFAKEAWLATVRRVLAPMGGLAVWSGYRADAFLARLRAAGFTPSLVPLRERERIRARAYVGRKDARR